MQIRIVSAALAFFLLMFMAMMALIISQVSSSQERLEAAEKRAATAAAEQRIAAYRNAVGEMAGELDARQAQLEEWQQRYFGNANEAGADVTVEKPAEGAALAKITALDEQAANQNLPAEARKLIQLASRQEALSAKILADVQGRAANAEAAIEKLGLNPNQIVKSASSGRGGPFIPYPPHAGGAKSLGASFAALDRELFRMEILERALVAMPSSKPADTLMMSSGFGYRSDPFSGAGAFHSGLDFRGPIGTPILSAAPGRVTFAGVKSGYGNVVEVDHGQGILTRYAHLSAFTSKVGQQVAAGQQIAKMGSTGRSTGSHLHFEVRIHGTAVNPRRFLEARADILEVKAGALQRVGHVSGPAI